MTIDKHNILKSAKKKDKLDELILQNPNIFKNNNTISKNVNTYDPDFDLSMIEHEREKARQANYKK